MLLSDRDIRSELESGRVGLDPLDLGMVQPSSVDVRLDRFFRLFDNHKYQHIDPALVAPGFEEFRAFLGQCRFRDCKHLVEQGCAVLAALERGDIGAERYDSFVNIVRDIPQKTY